MPRYRQLNLACSGIKLDRRQMDVPTFRKLLSCFNSNGALQEIEDLLDVFSDDELQSLVDVINEYILAEPRKLYQLEASYYALVDEGVLDSVFLQVGRLLEQPNMVVKLLTLLNNAYTSQDFQGRELFLAAIERLSERLTPDDMAVVLDYGLSYSDAPSFQALQRRFRGSGSRSLDETLGNAYRYFQEAAQPGRFPFMRETLEHLRDGKLFLALDEVIGRTEAQLAGGIPRMASVMEVFSVPGRSWKGHFTDSQIFSDTTSLFRHLRGPIHCLKGAKSIPDATMHVIRELSMKNLDEAADYIKRGNLLLMVAMNSLCVFPEQLGRFYPAMIQLADTEAIEPAVEVMKSFYRNGLSEYMVNLLADTGPEDMSGVKGLASLMSELNDRGAWEDLFYTVSLPREEDRPQLQRTLDFLMETSPMLGGSSVYEVMSDAFLNNSVSDVLAFAESLKPYIEAEELFLKPTFEGLRKSFYVNEVHPMLDVGTDLLSNARKHRKFFDTLFRAAGDHSKQIADAMSLVSRMAKNGQLRQLFGAGVTLFHRFAETGKHEIKRTEAPAPIFHRRHELSSVSSEIPHMPGWDLADPCRLLDTRIRMDEYTHVKWEGQLANFVNCINVDGKHQNVVDTVAYMQGEANSHGLPILNYTIDLLKRLDLVRDELGDLADRWIEDVDSGKFFHGMKAVPFWISRKMAPEENAVAGPVLYPLVQAITPVFGKSPSEAPESQLGFRRIMDYSASVLRKPEFPILLKYGEELWDRKPEPESQPDPNHYDIERIADWVRQVECLKDPDQIDNRVADILGDFRGTVNGWELGTESSPKHSYTKPEFRAKVEPLLQKFADPEQNHPDKSLAEAMLNIMRYFTLEEGEKPDRQRHFTPDELAHWLHQRAIDHRLIPYYYVPDQGPDHRGEGELEEHPRVRLVSSLDRLDLVLVNSDFTFVNEVDSATLRGLMKLLPVSTLRDNSGLKFLELMAGAWGDEPESSWPKPVYDRYLKTGKRPLTLRQAHKIMKKELESISAIIGPPYFVDCRTADSDIQYPRSPFFSGAPNWLVPPRVKARVFNLTALLPVIEENLPLTEEEKKDPELARRRPMAGGMRMLRNIFYEMVTSTPEEFRHPQAGSKNNLSVIIRLVRLGVMRAASRNLKFFSADDPAMLSFFRALIEGAVALDENGRYAMLDTIDALFANDREHRLAWNIFDETFDIIDSPEFPHTRQALFYALAQAHRSGIVEPAVRMTGPIFSEFYDVFERNSDLISDLLTSKRMAYMARALYEDTDMERKDMLSELLREALGDPGRGVDLMSMVAAIDRDEPARNSIKVFDKRLKFMEDLPAYQQLNVEDLFRDMLHFLQETPHPNDPVQTAPKIRQYIASLIEAKASGAEPSDAEEFMMLAKRNPDGFYQILQTLSAHIENGELEDFVRLARRSLAPPASP